MIKFVVSIIDNIEKDNFQFIKVSVISELNAYQSKDELKQQQKLLRLIKVEFTYVNLFLPHEDG